MNMDSISRHQSGGNSKSNCPSIEVLSFESRKWNQLFIDATTRRQTIFQNLSIAIKNEDEDEVNFHSSTNDKHNSVPNQPYFCI